MPKKMTRNKRRITRVRAATAARGPRVHSVKDLLAGAEPSLKRVTDQAARAKFWGGWLARHLPAAVSTRISGISEREGNLVIFAESAAWSARLRYAVLELEREIRAADPALARIAVRVLPRN
jgi:hypothetical protein